MVIRCKFCDYKKTADDVMHLLRVKDSMKHCPKCGTDNLELVPSVKREVHNSVEDIEWFKVERLKLHKLKAEDMGLEVLIKDGELLVRGNKSAVEFFQGSCDVYTISQLANYKVTMKFIRMLSDIPEELLVEGKATLYEVMRENTYPETIVAQLVRTQI